MSVPNQTNSFVQHIATAVTIIIADENTTLQTSPNSGCIAGINEKLDAPVKDAIKALQQREKSIKQTINRVHNIAAIGQVLSAVVTLVMAILFIPRIFKAVAPRNSNEVGKAAMFAAAKICTLALPGAFCLTIAQMFCDRIHLAGKMKALDAHKNATTNLFAAYKILAQEAKQIRNSLNKEQFKAFLLETARLKSTLLRVGDISEKEITENLDIPLTMAAVGENLPNT